MFHSAKFIRDEYSLDSYHVVRDRSTTAGGQRGRKKGAKSAFVCGLRNRKKRQFTLFLALPRVHTRPVSMCMYARLILRFSRKTSDRVSLDQWRWKHGARGVNYTWGYIPTQSSPPCIPSSRSSRSLLSFLLSRIYSPRPPFIRPETASCLPDLLTPVTSRSQNNNYI